jgi:hypothetical protein
MECNDDLTLLANSTDELFQNIDNLPEGEKAEKVKNHIKILIDGYSLSLTNAAYISYCIGYSWFWLTDICDEAPSESKKWLLESIRVAPKNNFFAMYYLGFLYFDANDFEKANNIINNIPSDAFKEYSQSWRDFNIRTLKACTSALLGLPNFDELNRICKIFENDLECEYDLPIYLVNTCLTIWDNNRSEGLLEFTRNIIEMLKKADYKEAFATEYKKLLSLLK